MAGPNLAHARTVRDDLDRLSFEAYDQLGRGPRQLEGAPNRAMMQSIDTETVPEPDSGTYLAASMGDPLARDAVEMRKDVVAEREAKARKNPLAGSATEAALRSAGTRAVDTVAAAPVLLARAARPLTGPNAISEFSANEALAQVESRVRGEPLETSRERGRVTYEAHPTAMRVGEALADMVSMPAGARGSARRAGRQMPSADDVRSALSKQTDPKRFPLREESLKYLREGGQASDALPVTLAKYPGEAPHIVDGRHRLTVARERGDKAIPGRYVEYDAEGNIVAERAMDIPLRLQGGTLRGGTALPAAGGGYADVQRGAFEQDRSATTGELATGAALGAGSSVLLGALNRTPRMQAAPRMPASDLPSPRAAGVSLPTAQFGVMTPSALRAVPGATVAGARADRMREAVEQLSMDVEFARSQVAKSNPITGGAAFSRNKARLEALETRLSEAQERLQAVEQGHGVRFKSNAQQTARELFPDSAVDESDVAALIGSPSKHIDDGYNVDTTVRAGHGELRTSTRITTADDETVGEMNRSFFRRESGELEMHNDLLVLREGVAEDASRKFGHDSYKEFMARGGRYVSLQAAWFGKWLWPHRGFTHADPEDFARCKQNFFDYLDARGIDRAGFDPKNVHEIAEWVPPKSLGTTTIKVPHPEGEMHVDAPVGSGKEFLLTGKAYLDRLEVDLKGDLGKRFLSNYGLGDDAGRLTKRTPSRSSSVKKSAPQPVSSAGGTSGASAEPWPATLPAKTPALEALRNRAREAGDRVLAGAIDAALRGNLDAMGVAERRLRALLRGSSGTGTPRRASGR